MDPHDIIGRADVIETLHELEEDIRQKTEAVKKVLGKHNALDLTDALGLSDSNSIAHIDRREPFPAASEGKSIRIHHEAEPNIYLGEN